MKSMKFMQSWAFWGRRSSEGLKRACYRNEQKNTEHSKFHCAFASNTVFMQ